MGDDEFDVCEGLVCVSRFADEGKCHPVWGGVDGFAVEDYGFMRLGVLVEWMSGVLGFVLHQSYGYP